MISSNLIFKISAIVILLLVCYSEAKFTSGFINSSNNFFYLGKFTYTSNKGPGTATIESTDVQPIEDAENKLIRIALYNNDPNAAWYWPNIEGDNLNCQEKFDLQYPAFDGQNATINNNKLEFTINDPNIWTWYFVITDCNLAAGSILSMEIAAEWKNHRGDNWYTQSSLEDQDLITIYLVFFVIWLFLFPVFIFCLFHFFLKHSYELDSNLKLFCVVLLFDFISLFMYVLHYSAYAIDGVGVPGIMVASDVLTSLSVMCFFILLIQVASLKKSVLEQPTYVWVILSGLLLSYLGLFFWQEIYPGLDPQSVTYRWGTIPGILMMTIQGVIWAFFIFLSGLSIRNADRTFFNILIAVIFSAWFLVLPFSAAFADLIPYYDRWKAVLGVVLSFNLFAYIAFCFFIFPNRFTNTINPISFAQSKYNERLLKTGRLFDDSDNSPYGSL